MPGEVVEPRTGHLGAALGVDGGEALAQLEVVARREARRQVAPLADVLAARRSRPRRRPARRRSTMLEICRLSSVATVSAASASACSALTCSARCLVRASSALLLVALGRARPACPGTSARPAASRTRSARSAGARRRRAPRRPGAGRPRGPSGWRGRRRDPPAGAADRSPEDLTDPPGPPRTPPPPLPRSAVSAEVGSSNCRPRLTVPTSSGGEGGSSRRSRSWGWHQDGGAHRRSRDGATISPHNPCSRGVAGGP